MARGIFVTATGTDVGKTYICALMVKKLRQAGLNAGYYKPVQSGAVYMDGTFTAEDALKVHQSAQLDEPPNTMVSYIYPTPASPHLAAQIAGQPVELTQIINDFTRRAQMFDYITVEGCGGIICPLRLDGQKIMLTDVIKALRLDILLVAPSGLGTINSTVLTVEFARQSGLNIQGIIFNRYDQSNPIHLDNKKQVESLTGIPILTGIPSDTDDLCRLYRKIM